MSAHYVVRYENDCTIQIVSDHGVTQGKTDHENCEACCDIVLDMEDAEFAEALTHGAYCHAHTIRNGETHGVVIQH